MNKKTNLMTTRRILMKLPFYLMFLWLIYRSFKDFKKQPEWNAKKKWNLVWAVFFTLALIHTTYDDFWMDY